MIAKFFLQPIQLKTFIKVSLTLVVLLTISATFLTNRNFRPAADINVEDDLPMPKLDENEIFLVNSGFVELPDPEGYYLLFKVDCPEDHQPCDYDTEIDVQHNINDINEQDGDYPKSHLGTLAGGGITFDPATNDNVSYAYNEGQYVVINLPEAPGPDDEYEFDATFVDLNSNERGPTASIKWRAGPRPIQPTNF